MQQPQAVLGEQYCSKYPRAYTVQPTNWGWSGGDAKILDEQGALAFSVDARAWAIKCDRVLADAAGNPVCAMQAKVALLSLCNNAAVPWAHKNCSCL